MTSSNRDWLKSLSDEQLAEEIKYSGKRARSSHNEHNQREYEEALMEQFRRSQQT